MRKNRMKNEIVECIFKTKQKKQNMKMD